MPRGDQPGPILWGCGSLKRAILSDIHGNLEALDAVLADLAAAGADEVVCLGDVIGYGPNPRECLDRSLAFSWTLLGNHEQGALYDSEGFSGDAARSLLWTRQQLEDPATSGRAEARWKFLCELPRTVREGDRAFVHASIRDPLSEYVFPEDVKHPRKLECLFALLDRCCFQGHTHMPGVFTEEGQFLTPGKLEGVYDLPQRGKVMINAGSVGLSRDGDPRACYLLVEGERIEFRRVAYPLETTIAKINAVPELNPYLGERLRMAK